MPRAPDLSGCALDDRYELQAVIGEGAFGRVYRGHDRRLKRTVAIKLIKPWWAGDYALRIAPGSDTARWSVWIEDWY